MTCIRIKAAFIPHPINLLLTLLLSFTSSALKEKSEYPSYYNILLGCPEAL
jgi:hypothetical protein